MFGVQSHKNKASATYSSATAMANGLSSATACFLTQQGVSVVKNVSTQLVLEIKKPKITALCCTPPIHRPLQLHPSSMHGY